MRRKQKLKYKSQLKIDRYNLEEELIRQPQLFSDWAIAAAKATDEKEAEKNKLEIIKSEVEDEIRKKPKKFGILDVKEGAIKGAIIRDKRVQKQTEKYLEACSIERILGKAETAFKHRKKMLISLVQLNVQLHFAEPMIPKATQETKYMHGKNEIRRSLKRRR